MATIGLVLRLALDGERSRAEKIHGIIYLGSGRSRRSPPLLASRICLIALCLLTPRLAFAQQAAPKVVTPVDLFLPENDPGMRVAPGLLLKSGIDATVEHDSNIYNQETGARSDQVAIVRPSLHLGTDWSRHALALDSTAEIRRYFSITSENSEQWDVKGLGSLDLGERLRFDAVGEAARRIELRGTAGDTFNTDRPVRLMQHRAAVQLARTGGILEVLVGGSLARLTYDDAALNGVPVDLGSRDVVLRQAHIRADYKLGAKIGLFADLSGNQVDYVRNTGIPRNSGGYAVLAGLHFRISALLDAQVAAGYIRQNFDDPLLRPARGANYALVVNWTPSPRWKIVAGGRRTIEPGPVTVAPAIVRSNFDLKVQRAVSDKVLAEATAGYLHESYRGVAREDNRYFADAAVFYRFSGHVLVSAHAGFRKQDSTTPGKSYDGFSAGLTVSVRL